MMRSQQFARPPNPFGHDGLISAIRGMPSSAGIRGSGVFAIYATQSLFFIHSTNVIQLEWLQ